MCEALAHVMDNQSGSQGYKTFQWNLFMFVIHFYHNLRGFMSKKNIGTHDAALDSENMANTRL